MLVGFQRNFNKCILQTKIFNQSRYRSI